MKAKISLVTLGVRDFGRAFAFYRDGLGFEPHHFTEGEDFCMFRMEGSWLALFPRDQLAADTGVEDDGRLHPGAQCRLSGGGGCGLRPGARRRGQGHEGGPEDLLGRLCRLFRRSGRLPLGGGAQPLHRPDLSQRPPTDFGLQGRRVA